MVFEVFSKYYNESPYQHSHNSHLTRHFCSSANSSFFLVSRCRQLLGKTENRNYKRRTTFILIHWIAISGIYNEFKVWRTNSIRNLDDFFDFKLSFDMRWKQYSHGTRFLDNITNSVIWAEMKAGYGDHPLTQQSIHGSVDSDQEEAAPRHWILICTRGAVIHSWISSVSALTPHLVESCSSV